MSATWDGNQRLVLREISFGARVAEEEAAELSGYFVETDQWQRMYRGDIDIVYGAKGSGKSAIFALLLSREDELFDRRILLASVEDPRGAPVFGQLVTGPPTSEAEFRALWKLYFLTLIGRQFREYRVTGQLASRVVDELEKTGLLEHGSNLRRLLHSALRYVRTVRSAHALEAGVRLDPFTGMPEGVVGRILFREPDSEERWRHGLISIDETFELADRALAESDLRIWLVLDRLDVAFAESDELEANALRALFRVYLGLRRLERISIKVFLRSDIWERITREGFREASHITRELTIVWNPDSLLHLMVRRLLRNDVVRRRFGVDERTLLEGWYQRHLFHAIFPKRQGDRAGTTFEWILSMVSDGSGTAAPRELIHLFNAARDAQIRRLEMGHPPPPGEALFDLTAFGEALTEVSRARLQQTVYAEHPQCRRWIEQLAGERTRHTTRSLASAWKVNEREAGRRAERLVAIGVLEQAGTRAVPTYEVPLLYRPALGLLAGTDWVHADDGDD